MYTAEDISHAISEPRVAGRELNRLIHTRGRSVDCNPNGESIFSKDWDNLIILDACRFDSFKSNATLSGKLYSHVSLGGSTREFIRGNFRNRKIYDTVYVSANSWYLKLYRKINSEIYEYIDLQSGDTKIDYFDRNLRIVAPECVSRFGIQSSEKYPNKRLIIHYLQPHHPFIGPIAQNQLEQNSQTLADILKSNENVSQKVLQEAYIENLEIVLSEVEKIVEKLDGKTVVTSDHGEMLGDRHSFIPTRDYGHHSGIYNNYLVKVPWFVHKEKERRHIVSEPPQMDFEQKTNSNVDDRLEKLGYKL